MGFARTSRSLVLLGAIVLAGCSGNGDGYEITASLSTDHIAFHAASPEAPTPSTQTVTATLGTDAVYVAIMYSGEAIANVTHTVTGPPGGKVAEMVVTPGSPAALGAGNFTGALTITPYSCADANCSRFTPGAAQVVQVTLGIPPILHFIAPYVATSGVSAKAIIRGRGFTGLTIQNVNFGPTSASEFFVINDTQLSVTYPTLAPGTYPVQIDVPDSPGAILSTAELVVVDAPGFDAGQLAYPAAITDVLKVVYDAERSALLLAVRDAGGAKLIRYPSASGVWGTPASVAITGLRDLTLAVDGGQLLVLSETGLNQTNPVSLTPSSDTPAPDLGVGVFLKNLAIANDGFAVVTTGNNATGDTPLYVYDARSPAFSQPATTPSLNNATPGAAGNGALVAIVQGDPSLTTAPNVYSYSAYSGEFGAQSIGLNQNTVAPVVDRNATRVVLNGVEVYNTAYQLLGKLPATTQGVAISPDATRAYTFDSTAGQVRTFDLTATNAATTDVYPEIGTGVSLAGQPGAGVKMIISPDGGTLFLAGCDRVVVQPTPTPP